MAPSACKKAQSAIWDCRVDEDRKDYFFSKIKLAAYLQTNEIRTILNCSCLECEEDRARYTTKAFAYVDQIVGRADENRGLATTLFGLFVHLKRPQLIVTFLQKHWNDDRFTSALTRNDAEFSVERLCKDHWHQLSTDDPKESQRLAGEFRTNMYRFAVPMIDSDTLDDYHIDIRLPFIKETKLAKSGSTATVYSFEIEEGYRSEKFAPGVVKFARKEFSQSKTEQSFAEQNNLERVKRLKDPHIIEMLKPYKHGEGLNIIFPKYSGDLDGLLRESKSPTKIGHPVGTRAEWRQFLGVVKAIRNIGKQNITASEGGNMLAPQKPVVRGYHFDLKPANILIADDGHWVVTDFGQAYFISSLEGNTSRVRGNGGTDAYAPPENDNVNISLSHRYDVWSLGCILLELIVFVVGEQDLVEKLDQIRTVEEKHGIETRYWEYEIIGDTGGKQKPILKKSVVEFVEDVILEHPMVAKSSAKFLKSLWEIALAMLEPIVDKRSNIADIEPKLEDLFESAKTSSNESTIPTETSTKGQHRLLRKQKYQYYPSNNPSDDEYATETVSLDVSLDKSSRNFIFRLQGRKDSEIQRLSRSSMFVPAYGFDRDRRDPFSRSGFYISNIDESSPTFRDCIVFAVENARPDLRQGRWPDAFAAQEACTGQHVIYSGDVEHFHYQPTKGALNGLFSKAKAPSEMPATTVAIWRYMPTSEPKDTGSRVPTYRLVLFSGCSLYIFTVKKEWVLNEKLSSKQNLVFGPIDDVKSPSFAFSILTPPLLRKSSAGPSGRSSGAESTSSRHSQECRGYAGIPLHPDILREHEEKHWHEVKQMTLSFAQEEEAKNFANLYLKVKEVFSTERHQSGTSRS